MRETFRCAALLVTGVLLGGFVLTACTVSFSGGMLGTLITGLLGALLVLGIGSTQSACGGDTTPPDGDATTPDGDTYVGPCLSPPIYQGDAYIGPCLSPLATDVGSMESDLGDATSEPLEDIYIGPCLSPIAPPQDVPPVTPDEGAADVGDTVDDAADTGSDPDPPDISIGPCLSPRLPTLDAESSADDGAAPDAATDTGFSSSLPDVDLGPCLSPPMPSFDAGAPADPGVSGPGEKELPLGPCLSPPMPTFDAGPEEDEATSQLPNDPPPDAELPSRREMAQRLMRSGGFPDDVVTRLTGAISEQTEEDGHEEG